MGPNMYERELGVLWREKGGLGDHLSQIDEGKSIFLGFLFLSLVAMFATFWFLFYLIEPRLNQIYWLLPSAIVVVGGLAALYASIKFTALTLAAITEADFFLSRKHSDILPAFLLPVSVRIASLFKVERDRVRNSFIKVNNSLVRAAKRASHGHKVLLLLPRCLQHSSCRQKITADIHNCLQCGKCSIAKVLDLNKVYGNEIVVATGGSQAREMIKRFRPTAIIGVACERELVAGIQDVVVIPVIAIPNERPEGPCLNTQVNIAEIERAIRFYIDPIA